MSFKFVIAAYLPVDLSPCSSAVSSANRISAPRPPPRRSVSPPRKDHKFPYYAKENNYRPLPPAQSYRDTYGVPRENNYRPQYDGSNPWRQPYSRGASQLSSAGLRRDLGSTRNASRDTGDRYSYRSYSPSPERPLRGRPPRRSNYGSRSRSASRSSRHASSPKATSVISRTNYGAPRRRKSRSRTGSRSRTRSLSSSDVASTRASQRSSREPPKVSQQQLPQDLSTKPPDNTNSISIEPRESPSLLRVTPATQLGPAENRDASIVAANKQQSISQPTAPKQEEHVTDIPKQTEDPVLSKGMFFEPL